MLISGRLSLAVDNDPAYFNSLNFIDDPVIADFVWTKTIYYEPYNIASFIGFMPSDQAIYITFRGTSGYQD